MSRITARRAKSDVAERTLRHLAALACSRSGVFSANTSQDEIRSLVAAGLAERNADGSFRVSDAGRAHLARVFAPDDASGVEPFLAQHCRLEIRDFVEDGMRSRKVVNAAESPLAWLARRKGKNGGALIGPHQFLAGERLRADFTFAQMMPRTTSNWESPVARARRSGGQRPMPADAALAARQRLQRTMQVVGPEFSGILMDVCCFLKGLEEVERDRQWPPRSAKIVLQLALERLARHYGLAGEMRGPRRAGLRGWSAPAEDVPAADA